MILGHRRQLEYLNKAVKNGRMGHAYLFYGPEHIGKFTVAKSLAKTFYCDQKPVSIERVCGECVQCRLIEQNRHAGVFLLDTQNTLVSKKDKRKDIPIGDIRELRRRLSFAPTAGETRVVIINEAQKLSQEAADAFLKILEEPGAQTVFILVCSSKESLPSTIVSRTQSIGFSGLSDEALDNFIAEKIADNKLKKELVFFSSGRPGVLFKLLEDKNELANERKFWQQIDSIFQNRDLGESFRFSEKISFDEELRSKTAGYFINMLRSRLLGRVSESGVAKQDIASSIGILKNIHGLLGALETTNVNPRLAIDSMFLLGLNGAGKII